MPESLRTRLQLKANGVYAIVNKVNSKVYIGSTSTTFKNRFDIHRRHLRLGKHGNQHLQSAWNKYGENAFEFVVIEECTSNLCTILETWWIRCYEATNSEKGYNIREVADSNIGIKRSADVRARQSERLKAYYSDKEVREKMAAAQRGKKHSAETKAKMSVSRTGRVVSQETRDRISSTRLKRETDAATKPVEYLGRTQSVAAWARELGLRKQIIYTRLRRGWSIASAFETPIGKYR